MTPINGNPPGFPSQDEIKSFYKKYFENGIDKHFRWGKAVKKVEKYFNLPKTEAELCTIALTLVTPNSAYPGNTLTQTDAWYATTDIGYRTAEQYYQTYKAAGQTMDKYLNQNGTSEKH